LLYSKKIVKSSLVLIVEGGAIVREQRHHLIRLTPS